MAQLQRSSKSSEHSKSPRAQANPLFEHHLQQNVLRTRSHDHEDHHKKSVFMKVKEKAKKLGRSISGKKKQETENHNDYTTTLGGEKFEDAIGDDENPDYLGAPMYESELSSDTLKDSSRQNPRANPVVPGNHTLSSCMKTEVTQGKGMQTSQDKTIPQSEPDQLAPADEKGSDATHSVASKVTGLTITCPKEKVTEAHSGGTPAAASAATGSNDEGLNNSERNQKLGPGGDEKALSQVTSESPSPKKSPGQGVVEKVKEAVTSLLWSEEEEPEPTIKNTDNSSQTREANYTTNSTLSSKDAVGNRANSSPIVPVPTNTSEVAEEQTRGRILQTN